MQFINEIITGLSNVIKTMSIIDIIDILIITLVIYNLALLIKNSRGAQVIKGISVLVIIYVGSIVVGLKTVTFLINSVMQIGAIALIIMFQPELRRFLEEVGNKDIIGSIPFFKSSNTEKDHTEIRTSIIEIANACFDMSKTKTGALIVIEKNMKLTDIAKTGIKLDAKISEELIGNIFYHNAPLHDGAMIVRNSRIEAVGCFLPLSQNYKINKNLGTRHRASIGISETADCVVITVSEETGAVSFSKGGKLRRGLSREDLVNILNQELLVDKKDKKDKKSKIEIVDNKEDRIIPENSEVKEIDDTSKLNENVLNNILDEISGNNESSPEDDVYGK